MGSDRIIHPSAHLGSNVSVGHFSVIGPNVVLADDVQIGNNVTVHEGTRIGAHSIVGDNSVLGKLPTAAKTSTLKLTDLPPLEVGEKVTVGVSSVIYAGTIIGPESLVADGAQVRERCTIGKCVIIGRSATVEYDTTIGDFSKLQTGAYITAKSTLEDHVFVAPGVTTTNDNYIGRTEARHALIRGPLIRKGARIGGGAVLLPGIEVGMEAVVGAGAVVTHDVPAFKVVVGCPARVVRDTPTEQLLFYAVDRAVL